MDLKSRKYGSILPKNASPGNEGESRAGRRMRRAVICLGCVLLFFAGCARVQPAGDGYPQRVIVHDSQSFWDAHQIKTNIIGLGELEVVRAVDRVVDVLIPGGEARPLESSIEWTKNQYAHMPDCFPFSTVGGLFEALGIEKLSWSRGPLFVPRIVYLVNWVQNTLGELNHIGGYLVPGQNRLIPAVVTRHPNAGLDWLESRTIGVFIFVGQGIDTVTDWAVDGGEAVWRFTVTCAVWPWK